MQKYDVAAYVWPAYSDDKRARIFWPEGMGEWQTVKASVPKYPGHLQPRLPLWGFVNEADPYVMQMQIDAAADHGVNVFIYDWYWYDGMPFLEGCLNNGYLKAANNHRVKFYIMWANHDVNYTWDKRLSSAMLKDPTIFWKGAVSLEEFKKICVRLIENYFKHPCYYKIDGKPVFSIYDLYNLILGLGGPEETAKALLWFKNEAVKRGLEGVHLQLIHKKALLKNSSGIVGDDREVPKEIVAKLPFDSGTHYQYVHYTPVNRDYNEIIKDAFDYMYGITKEYSMVYLPHVSLGWDSSPRFEVFRDNVVKNNTPEAVKKAMDMAKEFIKATKVHPLITVNSWNEWTEGSYLQPDNIYGYGYLEAVKKSIIDEG